MKPNRSFNFILEFFLLFFYFLFVPRVLGLLLRLVRFVVFAARAIPGERRTCVRMLLRSHCTNAKKKKKKLHEQNRIVLSWAQLQPSVVYIDYAVDFIHMQSSATRSYVLNPKNDFINILSFFLFVVVRCRSFPSLCCGCVYVYVQRIVCEQQIHLEPRDAQAQRNSESYK